MVDYKDLLCRYIFTNHTYILFNVASSKNIPSFWDSFSTWFASSWTPASAFFSRSSISRSFFSKLRMRFATSCTHHSPAQLTTYFNCTWCRTNTILYFRTGPQKTQHGQTMLRIRAAVFSQVPQGSIYRDMVGALSLRVNVCTLSYCTTTT